MDYLEGIVQKVTYYDDSKCFGIVKLKLDYSNPRISPYRKMLYTNIVSVLANFMTKPMEDEEYSFEGEFEASSYGMQFRAKTTQKKMADTVDGILSYLSSDKFYGIGRSTAMKVIEQLGLDCIEKILKDKSVLDKVDIRNSQKDTIYQVLVEDEEERSFLLDFLNLGFTMTVAKKLKATLGNDALIKIKENPYILMHRVEGFGFIRADAVAEKLGIRKDSPIRLKALICYVLSKCLENSGNTFVPLADFIMYVLSYANKEEVIVSENDVASFIEELKIENEVVIDEDGLVYSKRSYNDEVDLAGIVFNLLKEPQENIDKVKLEQVLNEVMSINDITYTKKQIEAITKAIEEPLVIISGGPGTGKSTIIKGIVDVYSNMFKNSGIISDSIALCAPTGRAAKRLKEVTLHDASTIHRLLKYLGDGKFEVNKDNPLDSQMVIVDEFSMVDQDLARRLFSSLKAGTKLVLVGDADQLPSVGIGNVLLDLINTKEITTVMLDQIHRQKEGSSIIDLAFDLKNGAIPYDILENKDDRRFIPKQDEEIIPFILTTIEHALESGMDMVKDIQVLVPTYRGQIGIDEINIAMQEKFNPKGVSVVKNGKTFRQRDKVLQLINRSTKGIMNGDIGYIEEIEYANDKFMKLKVVFDSGRVDYSFDELEELTLAYAISIHKSQGSEFALAIVPFSFKYAHMLKRKLVYTACTRAKKYLIMLGNINALRKGVVEMEEDRRTNLTKRIKTYINEGIKEVITEDEEDIEELTPFDFL